jgi:hypothetical protein
VQRSLLIRSLVNIINREADNLETLTDQIKAIWVIVQIILDADSTRSNDVLAADYILIAAICCSI